MKKDSFDHPKMKALARSLGEPIFAANGLVARLWWFAGQYTPAGDIGKFSDEAIADSLGYDLSKASELVASLVDSGFVDQSDEHRLIIHDWPDHCEDTIHAKLARKHEFFANGEKPKTRLLNNIEREKADAFYASGTLAAKKCNDVRDNSQCLSLSLSLSPCLKEEVRDAVAPPSPDGDPSGDLTFSDSCKSSNRKPADYVGIVEAWNLAANDCGFKRCDRLGGSRKRAASSRFNDSYFVEHWRSAIDRIRGSPFCKGKNDRNWKATIDWFLRPDTVVKILEGQYDGSDCEEIVF